jgi:AraC-like DNA-binding protein
VRESTPPPGVRRLFSYAVEGTGPRSERPPHRGLPSSTLTLVVAADSPLLCSYSVEEWSRQEGIRHDVCIGGFHTQPVYLQRPDREEGVQVAVHPLAARRLFGVPAAALSELTHEGEDVLGSRIRSLHARVASAHPRDRAGLVAEGLASAAGRYDRVSGPRREVVGAWRLLENSGGRMRVTDVASEVGVTTRHLSTLCKAELGIGTKSLADLLRFEAAHSALREAVRGASGPRPAGIRLADLAHDHGYADHAHLDAAYRRYTGTSPTGWIAEEFRNIQAEVPTRGEDSPV